MVSILAERRNEDLREVQTPKGICHYRKCLNTEYNYLNADYSAHGISLFY